MYLQKMYIIYRRARGNCGGKNRHRRRREDNYGKLKRWVLRFRLKASRDSDWRRGRGREFQAEGAAKENDRGPTVVRLMRGIFKRRESEAERRVLEGVYG